MPDTTRIPLFVLTPRPEPPPGVTHVSVDLTAFFAVLARVGNDPALLLLTIRALRVRMSMLLAIHELAWILRARPRQVMRWLERLSAARLVVYDLSSPFGRDAFLIEILEEPTLPDPPREAFAAAELRREHALPTHWFLHVLPRIGRTTFLVYLYLLRAEQSAYAVVHPSRLAGDLRLRSERHGLRHVRRLRRHGLVRRGGVRHGLTIVDPPPPTRMQRLLLRLVTLGLWPRFLGELLLYATLLLALLLLSRCTFPR
jgi:hypothetical protein